MKNIQHGPKTSTKPEGEDSKSQYVLIYFSNILWWLINNLNVIVGSELSAKLKVVFLFSTGL